MKRQLSIAAAVFFILTCVLFLLWQMGTFHPAVGTGLPAEVHYPDGTVEHLMWNNVLAKTKSGDAYRDPESGGYRYKNDRGQWGVAISPDQPKPRLPRE